MRVESKLRMSLSKRRGHVVLRREIAELASKSQLSKAINDLIAQGTLVRLRTGVYAKTTPGPSGRPLLPASRAALEREADARLLQAVAPKRGLVHETTRRPARIELPRDVDQLPTESVGEFIENFARAHGIRYRRSGLDVWAEAVTRASGDDVRLDHAQELLVALKKKNLLNDHQFSRLLTNHMREVKRVRSLQGLRPGGLPSKR